MKRLVPLVCAAALVLASCGASSPALEVNGQSLSRSDLFDELEELAATAEAAGLDTSQVRAAAGGFQSQFVAQVLNLEVQLRVVEQQLDSLGLDLSPADVDARVADVTAGLSAPQQVFGPLFGEFLAKKDLLDGALAGSEPSDEEILRAYEQNLPLWNAVIGRELCASHILLASEADAEAALAEIEAGADFADVAQRSSTGPSAPDGGDLGCAREGSYVPEFEAAAYAADPGEIVGPVETQFGYHLIQVREINEPPFDEAEDQLRAIIADQPGLFQLFLADISIDARFGTWDPGQLTVVPPTGPTT